MTKVRCAIYTRKSSDEGLDQAFNSLDAQREACAAYILSQASEGWVALPAIYDDGGLSGGTLERPALKRLLADIADGGIDIIVVYKVDRLTRSLFDFAKLVERLDKTGTSFVSVTQSFNTTTSMGRLTLNMLLSFAQFEREVTAERIRDKIAASKAKGMWMGGTPPLGYRPAGRTLAIDAENAALIQSLYHRYLSLGHVRALADALASEGSLVPRRTRANGSTFGGVSWSRGQIYMILQNPVYLGEIHHQGKVHQGLHSPIIDRTLWDEVQAKLHSHRQGTRTGRRAPNASMFAGRVVDDNGAPLIAVHATKHGKRYRYYVSKAAHHVTDKQADSKTGVAALRIAARELEAAVIERVREALRDPLALLPANATSSPAAIATAVARARTLTERNADGKHGRQEDTLARLVEQVAVGSEAIMIRLDRVTLGATLGLEIGDLQPLNCDARIRRCGGVVRLVQSNGQGATAQPPDVLLVRLIVKARSWWAVLAEGNMTITMLAIHEGVTASYLTRVVRLAFLSPEMIDAISTGKIGADVDQGRLLATDAIAACWKRQRVLLGVN